MEFNLFHFSALLSVAFVASHAVQSSEDYWRSVLPNTPMPKSVSELLQSPEWMDEKSTVVDVGEGNVGVNTGNSNGTGTHVEVGKGSGVGVITGAPGEKTEIGVGRGVVVRSENRGKPVYVGVQPGVTPFDYQYAASAAQLHDNPNVALFFLENDLHQGTNMNLHFTKPTTTTNFLPRKVADSIPFSSNEIPEIFSRFSVKQNTLESETIKSTLSECEAQSIKGEEKYCATSLETMIDFSTSKLGKKVIAVSTVVEKESEMQRYRIVGSKKLGEKAVICHKQNYPYAVFYCHMTNNVKAYTVSLVGNDGTKAKAAAICHTDTSSWNPKHLAFQVLNVKPGSVPVCHFLPEDHVVWVPY
ncbi:BURP domain-containing protein [Heracleum sosnowskyi]|uniref:BURP domain-containing protein n=1 Tax=Heracleum sosnowskyi TaxID=360622 RepID=A0AAD8MCZ8_9APIA|nr:BURP domain-containing protein [Heracleum sosnowskyi]